MIAPGDFNVLFVSGLVAVQRGQYSDAAEWLARAASLQPRSAPCALHHGFALAKLGQHAKAEAALREAVRLAPKDPEAWDALGYVLKILGRLDDSLAAYRRAVQVEPRRAASLANLGQTLLFAGRPGESLTWQDRAIAVDPTSASAHFGRALALQQCHRIPEAVAAYGETLRRAPDHHEARSYRLMALNYLDGQSRAQIFAEHTEFAAALTASAPRHLAPRLGKVPRVRVAFLSPDLRLHSIFYFLEPLLAHLNPAEFEVMLYHDHFVVDHASHRLRARASVWRNFVGQPDAAVEAVILADAPDVLVDLAGHTGLNRMSLLARRLAPVQISYLGYPNTTGLRTMDYRFVDPISDPAGEDDRFHSEQLVRFAATAWAYQPPAESPEPGPRTAGAPIVFGCFNNFAKVTDAALAAWSRLLTRVPDSRLRLKTTGLGEAVVADQIRRRLADAGIDVTRVDLIDRTPGVTEHLALYHGIDVALDTFPYHGTTTTCEALWMGVPVVTLAGDRHAARVGASILTAVGRREWIAQDWDEYVQCATSLAFDADARVEARGGLRDAMRASVLMDHAGQAARFAAAVRGCWAARCARSSVAA
jgi:predicted O-linked N-acetylglucosamine transferase (SPINDLY family)